MSGTGGGGIIIIRRSTTTNIRGNAGWSVQNDSDYDVSATDADLDSWFYGHSPSSDFVKIIPGFGE